jgi:hypothetical protein
MRLRLKNADSAIKFIHPLEISPRTERASKIVTVSHIVRYIAEESKFSGEIDSLTA